MTRARVLHRGSPPSRESLLLNSVLCRCARRELVIDWTLSGGKSCADVGVANIEIDIGGESCAAAGVSTVNILLDGAPITDAAGDSLEPATLLCGGPGSSASATITICDPGALGCGASSAGLAAGVWWVSATVDGYIAPVTRLAVPN